MLCGNILNTTGTTLYVFGCNLFGQLGIGQQIADMPHQKLIKSLVPLQINMAGESITQIHTKFFTNVSAFINENLKNYVLLYLVFVRKLVITKSNKLYSWGASPQLIRLMNQARKRARMAQKFEKTKTTIVDDTSDNVIDQNSNQSFTEAVTIESNVRDREENYKNCVSSDNNRNGIEKGEENINDMADKSNKDALIIDKISNSVSGANLEERIKKFLKSKASSSQASVSSENSAAQPETDQTEYGRNGSSKSTDDFEDEYTEHLYPNEIDCSNITGEIIQASPLHKCV